jgi:uncharacterized membrane protein YdjX (TVP38/TMEM64 family)
MTPAGLLGDFALMVLFALTPLPAEIAALAVAMRNPLWLGAALIWTGAMTAGLIAYGVAWRSERARAWLCRWRAVREAEARLKDLGWLAIFGLRLIPIVPYFAVSLAAGLLRVPLGAFAGGTALGIVPATLVLALVGRGLMSERAGAVLAAVGAITAVVLLGLAIRFRGRW